MQKNTHVFKKMVAMFLVAVLTVSNVAVPMELNVIAGNMLSAVTDDTQAQKTEKPEEVLDTETSQNDEMEETEESDNNSEDGVSKPDDELEGESKDEVEGSSGEMLEDEELLEDENQENESQENESQENESQENESQENESQENENQEDESQENLEDGDESSENDGDVPELDNNSNDGNTSNDLDDDIEAPKDEQNNLDIQVMNNVQEISEHGLSVATSNNGKIVTIEDYLIMESNVALIEGTHYELLNFGTTNDPRSTHNLTKRMAVRVITNENIAFSCNYTDITQGVSIILEGSSGNMRDGKREVNITLKEGFVVTSPTAYQYYLYKENGLLPPVLVGYYEKDEFDVISPIEVDANITIEGTVSIRGDYTPAIQVLPDSKVTIDGTKEDYLYVDGNCGTPAIGGGLIPAEGYDTTTYTGITSFHSQDTGDIVIKDINLTAIGGEHYSHGTFVGAGISGIGPGNKIHNYDSIQPGTNNVLTGTLISSLRMINGNNSRLYSPITNGEIKSLTIDGANANIISGFIVHTSTPVSIASETGFSQLDSIGRPLIDDSDTRDIGFELNILNNAIVNSSGVDDSLTLSNISSSWNGILYDGDEGIVYGETVYLPTGYTFGYEDEIDSLPNEYILPYEKTLTIPAGTTLIIDNDVTVHNWGSIVNNGTIENNGTFINHTDTDGITGNNFTGNGDYITTYIDPTVLTLENIIYNGQGNEPNKYEQSGNPLESVTILGADFILDGSDNYYDLSYKKNTSGNTYTDIATTNVDGVGKYSKIHYREILDKNYMYFEYGNFKFRVSEDISIGFTIEPKDINDADLEINDKYWTSSAITLSNSDLNWTVNSPAVITTTDYTLISYVNNTDSGDKTASVTIDGTGNYTNTRTDKFSIIYTPSYVVPTESSIEKTYGESFTVGFTTTATNPISTRTLLLSGTSNDADREKAILTIQSILGGDEVTIAEIPATSLGAYSFSVDTATKSIPTEFFNGTTHTLTIKWGGGNIYGGSEETVNIKLNPKELSWSDGTVQTKDYDGKDTATVTTFPALSGVVSSDDCTVAFNNVKFSDVNAGENLAVTYDALDLDGTHSDYYVLPTTDPNFTGTISKITPSISGAIEYKASGDNIVVVTLVPITVDGNVELLDGTVEFTIVSAGGTTTETVNVSDNKAVLSTTTDFTSISAVYNQGSGVGKNYLSNSLSDGDFIEKTEEIDFNDSDYVTCDISENEFWSVDLTTLVNLFLCPEITDFTIELKNIKKNIELIENTDYNLSISMTDRYNGTLTIMPIGNYTGTAVIHNFTVKYPSVDDILLSATYNGDSVSNGSENSSNGGDIIYTAEITSTNKNNDPLTDLTYSWEVSTDGGTTWNNITEGVNGNICTISSAKVGSYLYRCEVVSAMNNIDPDKTSATSDGFEVTVLGLPFNVTIEGVYDIYDFVGSADIEDLKTSDFAELFPSGITVKDKNNIVVDPSEYEVTIEPSGDDEQPWKVVVTPVSTGTYGGSTTAEEIFLVTYLPEPTKNSITIISEIDDGVLIQSTTATATPNEEFRGEEINLEADASYIDDNGVDYIFEKWVAIEPVDEGGDPISPITDSQLKYGILDDGDTSNNLSKYTYHNIDDIFNKNTTFNMVDYNVTVKAIYTEANSVIFDNSHIACENLEITPLVDGKFGEFGEEITVEFTYNNGEYKLVGMDVTPLEVIITPNITSTNENISQVYTFTFTMPDENVVLTPVFEYDPLYNITTIIGANGSIDINVKDIDNITDIDIDSENIKARENQNVTFTIIPDDGYRLNGLFAVNPTTLETTLISYDPILGDTYTFVMPNNDVIITAKFKVYNENATYTVTVNDGFGSGVYSENDVVNIAYDNKRGYTFDGWTVNSHNVILDDEFDNTEFKMPANNVVITANYTEDELPDTWDKTYKVTVINGYGGGLYASGDEVSVIAEDRVGYSFLNWSMEVENGDTIYFNDTEEIARFIMANETNIMVTANYDTPILQDNEYTLVVENGDGDGIYKKGTSIDITANKMMGFEFAGWEITTGKDLLPEITDEMLLEEKLSIVMPSGNLVFEATYNELQNNIDYNNVEVINGTGGGIYVENYLVRIEAQVPQNTTFVDWIISGELDAIAFDGEDAYFFMPSNDIVALARYIDNDTDDGVYTVTVSNGNGSGDYQVDDIVTIQTEQRTGFNFVGWVVEDDLITLDNCNNIKNTFEMIDRNLYIRAEFERIDNASDKFVVTVIDGYGSGIYANEDTINIAPYEKDGFELDYWEVIKGDISLIENQFVMIDEDVILIAIYKEVIPQIEPPTQPPTDTEDDGEDDGEDNGEGEDENPDNENGDGTETGGSTGSTGTGTGGSSSTSSDDDYSKSSTTNKVTVDDSVVSTINPFIDVFVNDWFYNDVIEAYELGLMYGIFDNEFAPYMPTNRAMIVTILHRLEGLPTANITNDFLDTLENTWYSDAVDWGFENDVAQGYGNDLFKPLNVATREEFASFLCKYAQYKDIYNDDTFDLSIYEDEEDISFWAVEAVQYAVANGLMIGKSDDRFYPSDLITRAEVATIINRLYKLFNM